MADFFESIESVIDSAESIGNNMSITEGVDSSIDHGDLLSEMHPHFHETVEDSFGAESYCVTTHDLWDETDASSPAVTINCLLEENLAYAEELVAAYEFHPIVFDEWEFIDLGITSGNVWETWVFNTDNFAPSVYSGYSFNSYAELEGRSFGAKEEGIFVLEGDTDEGEEINTGVIFTPSAFGLLHRKHFRKSFFDIEGRAPIIRAETNGVGVSVAIANRRAFFPRTLMGMRWTFMIAEFDELGPVELFPIIITR